jgi:two-component system sensor histidine kinase/response regulator
MRERPRARLVAYGIAVAAPAVFLLLRWPLWPILSDAVPHMTFFPAVMLAAYCGGFWPGLLATILSAAAANYFLTGQLRALHVTNANDVAAVILFLLTGTMISALCESLHRAHRRILAEERRRAEEARRESSERFRILVQNSSDIVSLFDAQGTILYQAPSIERVLGHPSHDRIGRNIFRDAIVHPDDLQAKRAFFDEIVSRPGVPITADFRLRHANGSWRDIEAVGQNFLHDPSVAGIVANYRDITARKRAEEALRQSETRLHRLLDALPTAAYTCDTEGLITYFNERAVELWGRSPKLNHPDDRFCGSFKLLQIDGTAIPHNQCGMAVAIKEEREIKGLEVIIERADGSHRNVLAHINPLLDSDRRLLGAVNVVVDITDLKRAEEALRESEQRWRHLTEALPQLVWTAVDATHRRPRGRTARLALA